MFRLQKFFFGLSSPQSKDRKRRRQIRRRALAYAPTLDPLEDRTLLSITNVLVTNPAMDTSVNDTKSNTALVLGAGNNIVVAYNDADMAHANQPDVHLGRIPVTLNSIPMIASLSQTSAVEGEAGISLTVSGSLFTSSSVVDWNGNAVPTRFVSSTQLTASISSSLLASPGTFPVTVVNPPPGGGTSNTINFTVTVNAVPVLSILSPTSAVQGSASFFLTVNGSAFTDRSVVRWNGNAVATTFVSSTKLTASISTSLQAVVGTFPVTVFNPLPDGGTSNAINFTVTINPVPVITSLSQTSAFAGAAPFSLTVNGSSFISSSVVDWNGSSVATTFVNSTQLTASISVSLLLAVGTFPVTVFNPSPGGGTSIAINFTVSALPVPVIASLSATSAVEGAASISLTVNGSSFVNSSVVRWNGNSVPTAFVNSTQLTASISTRLLADEGTSPVTVFSPQPGGGTSNAITFTIQDASLSAVTGAMITATQGRQFSAPVATFTDGNAAPMPLDFTVTITWGDGQSSAGVPRTSSTGNFDIIGIHTYTAQGRYTVSIAIADDGGSLGNATSTAHVASTMPPPHCLATAAGVFSHSPEYFSDFVTNEYMTLLNRMPDGPGLAGWVNAMANGTRAEQIEAAFVSSPEYIQAHGGVGSTWVRALYHDLLQRTPSDAEVQGWLQALGNGTSAAAAATIFSTSPERETIRVQSDYMKYLGRTASPSEVSGWLNDLLDRTMTNEGIIADFVGSLEYWQKHFSNNVDWLYGAYNDFLNRTPDSPGLNAFLNTLQNC
jgi:hypothetical protein